jgi:sugar phosphate isomerase/epimerase
MIRSSVTVSLVPEARGGPFVFWEDYRAAAFKAKALGFDAIEIFTPGPDAIKPSELLETLEDTGLKLAAVGTGAGWVKHKLHLCLADAVKRQQARDFIRAIIDFAGPFGAPAIIGSMQGRHGDGVSADQALAWLAEALDDLGSHAADYGVPLIYEPLNRYETNIANTLASASAMVRGVGSSNVKLLADLFHMNIEETDIAAALLENAEMIGHIHFVDSNRRPAGLGHMPWGKIATALHAMNYGGYLSAEAFPYPDSDAAALQTITTYRKLFT